MDSVPNQLFFTDKEAGGTSVRSDCCSFSEKPSRKTRKKKELLQVVNNGRC